MKFSKFIALLGLLFQVHEILASSNTPDTTSSDPPNIHAVIVSTSRYWFNYRHVMNALGIYQTLKTNGVPDSQIILMLADEYATNSRNPFKNELFANGRAAGSWYSEATEIDYRGSDVTVQNFINALLGNASKALESGKDSNLLIYLTGHGGDQFLKFQDEEELTAQDIANLANTLFERQKFGQALWIADTCQAFTLFDKVTSPNTLSLGTSLRGENAFAHHSDKELGLSVIERWTHEFLTNYAKPTTNDSTTLDQVMVAPFKGLTRLGAHVGTRQDTSTRKFEDILVSEFFGPKKKKQKQKQKVMKTIVAVEPGFVSVSPPVNAVEAQMPVNEPKATNIGDCLNEEAIGREVLEPTDSTFRLLVGGFITAVILASVLGKQSP